MSWRIGVLLLAWILAGAVGCTTVDVAAEVEAGLWAQQEAWNRGDLDAFMALGYWNSPQLAFLSGDNWTQGFEETLAGYRKRYVEGDSKMGKLTFSDLEVLPLGKGFAAARGRWRLHLPAADNPSGLFTLILERLPVGWRIVHDHTSSAPAP